MSHDHGHHTLSHSHDEWESPGSYAERAAPQVRDLGERSFTIGIGGPVGSGKTGGCPHAAIREDVGHNLLALEELVDEVGAELLFVESGGDNLAAQYSRELADFTLYVIDVAGGDKLPRTGDPGITQSDLLVIDKTDLAPHVGADLGVIERDAARTRGEGPTIFAQVAHGVGVDEIASRVVAAWGSAS